MSARTIFIIRHGEKPPEDPPPHGVDVDGDHNSHSLDPLGWQRAGALTTLFAPFDGQFRAGLARPTQLIAPDYGDLDETAIHRPYQTVVPLAEWLGIDIETPYAEGDEKELGKSVAAATSGVTLICWEHSSLHKIADHIPTPAGTTIPKDWPDDRFDVVWSFELDPGTAVYAFSQIPEMLLAGDVDTGI